ncbi:hypothetical protein ACFSQT_11775 [Mesorhizobium calcicola]|uniref:Uncharacterized protein n=1 Tax=Mesorhizobium calcicola TaxID=1300310 RepID=A0ABW4WB07_9HYPH
MGNLRNGVIRKGGSLPGSGVAVGNVKDGVIRNGSSVGSGTAIGNIKDGIVRNGSSKGSGSTVGKVSDFTIKGIERERDDEIVAVYNFLIKKFL